MCSGVAFVYHYSETGSSINVKISGIPDVIVEGTSIQFKSDLIGYNGSLSYRWCVNSTFLSTSRYANITFYNPGIHTITLSVYSKDGSTGSDTVFINVLPRLNVLLFSNLSNVTLNQNITITSKIVGGVGPFYYNWYSNTKVIRQGYDLSNISYSFHKSGKYNIGLVVNNSGGYFGSSSFNFDPWNFSESIKPTIRQGFGVSNSMAEEQTNVDSGNLIFHFLVYNPTNSVSKNNITVYLYNKLPAGGPSSSSLFNFTFSSGSIEGGGSEWVNVNSKVYWNYSELVVIPQSQTGTSGNEIGVANPQTFNYIFSHYWVPPWDTSDDGFIGYWTESNNVTINVE